MKLVYYALTAGALVEAGRSGAKRAPWKNAIKGKFSKKRTNNQEKFLCRDSNDTFFSHGNYDIEEYNRTIDAKLAAFAETLADETPIEEHCEKALQSEICVNFNQQSMEEIEAKFSSEFPRGSDCGDKAAKWINQMTLCQVCEDVLSTEEIVLESAQRNLNDDESLDFNGNLADSLMQTIPDFALAAFKRSGDSASEADAKVSDLNQDKESVSDNQISMMENADVDGLESAGKSAAGIQSISSAKSFFKKISKACWNVVYSGGPEYCKDLMPRFPRITLKRDHPNYIAMVRLKDNCILMHSIIKGTRCFCRYLVWGCPDFRSVKRCDGKWQNRHGSKSEIKICWYFSNLKNGVTRTKNRPLNPTCTTIKIPHEALFEKQPCPFKGRRIRKRRCPSWKPKRNYSECLEARIWHCNNSGKKRWLINKCIRNCKNADVHDTREWCVAVMSMIRWAYEGEMKKEKAQLEAAK